MAVRHFARQGRRRRLHRMGTPKERLEAMLAELRAEVGEDIANLARDIDSRGEDTTPSQHPADVASDLYAREELVVHELALAHEVEEIEGALRRIAAGTYGRCEECGGTVDPARLEARPQAALCITCQRRREDRRGRSLARA
ncbi:MAG TPA: TraR/DksA C4-type zinc finger protein [Candidatus Limnocylindria bacterium]|nr:TraR/DksA C4-type zinc finger protein [Candidatus Limnocylindria bacterium]